MYNLTTTSTCVAKIHVLYQKTDPMQQHDMISTDLPYILLHVLQHVSARYALVLTSILPKPMYFRILKILLMARNMT